MSLIPYNPREGREIVLRHRNAIVVRDTTSQRLEIRGLPECPTCHQPINRTTNNSSFERPFDLDATESYVDPNYFRMLQAGRAEETPRRSPPSPIRRLFQPALAGAREAQSPSSTGAGLADDVEFVSSTPGVAQAEGSRIRREAFSPNYFNTFFVEEKVLGKGGKGVVLLVRHEIDGCHLGHFACKRVPVGDDHAWLEKVLIEVELLAKLSHPNLVSYRHVWLEDVQLTRFGPTVACAFILQQYCNSGDLQCYVVGNVPRETSKEELKARMRRRSKGQAESAAHPFSSKTPLSFEEIYSLFKDITSGVAYLHNANYIHRDLKPSNCLLHREGGILTCLISDFGEVQAENVVRKSTGSTGTISYCAPEVLKLDASGCYGNFTTKSDIFSLGMILYFMCFGRLPYRSANALQEELEDIDALRAEITDWRGFRDERRERPDLPAKLYALLKKLLALNPLERPSAAEILTAMRSEASFEGFAREHNTPSIDVRGIRVQNLDSPATPGTPVPDSRRQQRPVAGDGNTWGTSPLAQDSSPSKGLNQRGDRSASPSEITAIALTRNPGLYQGPSMSPEPSESAKDESEQAEEFIPRLLLPPPRTGLSATRYKAALTVLRLANAAGLDLAQVTRITRLAFFLVKMTALTRPCWPFMVNFEVSVPLVIVAALDLGPSATTDSMTVRRHSPRQHRSWIARDWGLGTSFILMMVHFAVVWLARRSEALCAAATQQPDWTHWKPDPVELSP